MCVSDHEKRKRYYFFFQWLPRFFLTKEASFMATHSKERFVYLPFMTRTFASLTSLFLSLHSKKLPHVCFAAEHLSFQCTRKMPARPTPRRARGMYDFDRHSIGHREVYTRVDKFRRYRVLNTLTRRHTIPLPSCFGRKWKTRVRLRYIDVKLRNLSNTTKVC